MTSPNTTSEKTWTPLELAEMKTGRRFGAISRARGVSGRKRFKARSGACSYHVMSRTVGGEFLLGTLEKEAFRRMMWRVASFCGVDILTYVVMDNHFHILLHVPDKTVWLRQFDGENGHEKLLKHLSTIYSKAFIKPLV